LLSKIFLASVETERETIDEAGGDVSQRVVPPVELEKVEVLEEDAHSLRGSVSVLAFSVS
jgi:hypothetical protein